MMVNVMSLPIDTPRPCLIDGGWHLTAATLTSRSPLDGATLGQVACGDATTIDAAVQAARRALPAWRAADEATRRAALRRLHAAVLQRREALVTLIHRETGKAPFEALAIDVLPVLNALDYYARHGARALRDERLRLSQPVLLGHRARLVYAPAGVVGIIGPWNVPLALPLLPLAAALIAGNTVVLKPSEWTPLVGHAIAELCAMAQLPPGVVNVVTGGPAAGAALAEHEGTQRIVFIGGVAGGRRVAEACARRLCPCVLELGGVGAALVRADANLEVAARGVVWTRFMGSGQICAATQRVFVDRRIAAPFTEAVTRQVRRLRVGRPGLPWYDVGPLINAAALQRVREQIDDALASGARLVVGGTALPEHGPLSFAPTVLTDVTPAMRVMREESFGPLLAIMPVRDDEEAVTHLAAVGSGLATTIWTRDLRAGMALAQRIESGMVWLNEGAVFFSDPVLPWGGLGSSGWGHIQGRLGLQAVTNARVIAGRLPWPALWWFPYRRGVQRLIEVLIAVQHERRPRAVVRALAQSLLRC